MIYLDHHAATPLANQVVACMADALKSGWANPSSVHAAGRAAKRVLEHAREQVAAACGAHPAEVLFTGGGTEAVNLAIAGLRPENILTTEVEHPAAAACVDALAATGVQVRRLPVKAGKPPSAGELAAHLDPQTLVVVQWINHETGTIFPIEAYAQAVSRAGGRIAVDATQALGKRPIDFQQASVDAIALAAQKLGGPSGAGGVLVRRDTEIEPAHRGGSQERGRRAGTPDVVALAGFGAASELVDQRLAHIGDIGRRRDRLEAALIAAGAVVNATNGPRVETVTNLAFSQWRADALVAAMDLEGVAISAGAACSSGLAEPSAVIAAMYPDEPWRASASIRISLGPENTDDEVEAALDAFARVLKRAK